jgi:hypothetical protein
MRPCTVNDKDKTPVYVVPYKWSCAKHLNFSHSCLMLTPASLSKWSRTRSSISSVRMSLSSSVNRKRLKCSRHLWTDAAVRDETRQYVHCMEVFLSSSIWQIKCSRTHSDMDFFFFILYRTRAQNLPSLFGYTLYWMTSFITFHRISAVFVLIGPEDYSRMGYCKPATISRRFK